MPVESAPARKRTAKRPPVPRLTASLPHGHHILEDILSWRSVRKALEWLSGPTADGACLFEKICAHYDRPSSSLGERLRWAAPNFAINLGLKKAKLDKEVMKKNLFHHPPTVKALALTARSIGRYGLSAPQRFCAPLFVVWNLTQACNLSCKHCYQNAKHRPDLDELTTIEKLDLIDQFADELVPFIAFAGGEPMVARDFWQVMEHCQRRGIHTTIATNGTLLTRENCARLIQVGVKYVEVSIDSIESGVHDSFRGMDGAWSRSIEGIRNSVASGMRTGMAACFTRETVARADEMIEFAIQLGCKTFAFFNFIPVGRGLEMMHEDLTPSQRESLLRKLQGYLEEGRINVISTAPQFGRACIAYGAPEGIFATGHAGGGRGKKTMVLARYIGGCGSGRCYCSIQPNGTVTPCVYIPGLNMGNVRERRFREIWDNELFTTLSDRNDRGDHCAVCDYRVYCGGCRARALAYTGDIQAGDPGCVFNTHVWDEMLARDAQAACRRGIASIATLDAAALGVADRRIAAEAPGERRED